MCRTSGWVFGVVAAAVLAGGGPAQEPKKEKTVEEVVPFVKGVWSGLGDKPVVTAFQFKKFDKRPAGAPTEYHVGLAFGKGDPENYSGPADRVVVEKHGGLKITLPGGDLKRRTLELIVRRDETKAELDLLVLDGPHKGSYRVAVPPKKSPEELKPIEKK